MSVQALAEAWPEDHREAFARLYRDEAARLLGYGEGVVRDAALAADLVHESFVRLYERWHGVREPRDYLFGVLTNLIRNHWRSLDRERAALDRFGSSPARGDEDHERTRAVRDAVERLPARLREVVLLHYFTDCPVDRVALTLDRPLGTVKRQLHEARGLLAAALAG